MMRAYGQVWEIRGDVVEKFRTLEHLKAQVTVVRWHLDAMALETGDKRRRHLDSAVLTYQGALELMTQLVLSDEEHAAVTKQLEELRERLLAAGQPV
jgi:transposase